MMFSGDVIINNAIQTKVLEITDPVGKKAQKTGRRIDAPPGHLLTSSPAYKWAKEKREKSKSSAVKRLVFDEKDESSQQPKKSKVATEVSGAPAKRPRGRPKKILPPSDDLENSFVFDTEQLEIDKIEKPVRSPQKILNATENVKVKRGRGRPKKVVNP